MTQPAEPCMPTWPGLVGDRFLRPADPAAALAQAAVREGFDLRPSVAVRLAAAVLEYADTESREVMEVAPQLWPAARMAVLQRLGVKLAMKLVDEGQLPTALPREVVTPGIQPWDLTKVELVVPVRRAQG